MKLCESYNRQYGTDFRSLMPTNLYGPHDNFNLQLPYVLPASLTKFHQAPVPGIHSVAIWGTGDVRREYLHVQDFADICLRIMTIPMPTLMAVTEPTRSHINIGSDSDITIRQLAMLVASIVGSLRELRFNSDYPSATLRKLLRCEQSTKLGWRPKIDLWKDVATTYRSYVSHLQNHAS